MRRQIRKLSLSQHWFPLAIAVIAAVSIYDTLLIVHFSEVIGSTEENPVGQWLLTAGNGSIWIFVRFKIAGTVFVLSALHGMWLYSSRLVFPVTTSVASCQVGLFMYLTVV